MNYEQLKNSILQEAIEGRLVPQDPNDEPASVLLDRIAAEKVRLVKAKEIKRDKNESRIYRTDDGHWMERFFDKKRPEVCIDDEIPFDIPETWEWQRFENICIHNPTVDGDDNDDAAFMPMALINEGLSGTYTYQTKKWKQIKNGFRRFQDGDFAFAKITPCFQNGKSILPNNLPNGIGAGTTELYVVRAYENTMLTKYIFYFVKSPYFMLEAKFKGTAGQQRVLTDYIEQKLVPIPPLSEQHRIVEKLETILPKVEEYGKAQDRLDDLNVQLPEKLKASILQEAIEGRLVPQNPDDEPATVLLDKIEKEKATLVKEKKIKPDKNASRIYRTTDGRWFEHFTARKAPDIDITEDVSYDIPESWELVRLGKIAQLNMGKTPERGNATFWSKKDFPWVSISDMIPSGITKETKESVSKVAADKCFKGCISKKGSLLMSFKLTIGRTTILGIDAYHNEAIITIIPHYDKDNLLRDYLFTFLPMLANQGDSKEAIKGKTLNSKSLYNILVPLPPLSEESRIVNKINSISPIISNLIKPL